jgi:hypothetical protein
MRGVYRSVMVLTAAGMVIGGLFVASANAMQFSSSDFVIDAATLNNVGGFSSSSNYQLTSSGGEAAIGDGSGGSYKLAAGYVAQIITPAITVTTQPSSLVAYYPLDEGAGTLVHDDISNNSGTIEGAAGWFGSGKIGSNSVDITQSGSGDIRIPHSNSLPSGQVMTIEAWIRSSSYDGMYTIAGQWDWNNNNGAYAWQTTSAGTGLRFFMVQDNSDGGENYVDTADGLLSINTWQHVVLVYNGAEPNNDDRIKMYVDGVEQPLTVTGTIRTSINPNTADLYLGHFQGLNRYFEGAIDQVKIFDRALSSDEVAAEYNAQNQGVVTGLSLATVVPGASNSTTFDVITDTSGSSYNLAINQDHDLRNLQNASYTIPAISGSIASPAAWSEGTTKGLGFSVVSSTATAPSASWGAGSNYAALPSVATAFYTRSGIQNGKDTVALKLRSDVASVQPSGAYQNIMTITGTANP